MSGGPASAELVKRNRASRIANAMRFKEKIGDSMVVMSLLVRELTYTAKDEEAWRSVNRETQEDSYERKITKDLG
jgi:hypothetical protein